MMKIVIAAVIVVIATAASVLASPPLLHSARKAVDGKLGGFRAVQVQRCANIGCTTGCNTVVEFPLYQCHNEMRAFSHGEILRVAAVSAQRVCFRENMYISKNGEGCKGKLEQSAPREIGQCVQDVFPPGRFSIFRGNGSSMIMARDCDFGCRNCGMEIPVGFNQCILPTQNPKFADVAFENGNAFTCGGSGWDEIIADHFEFPTCDGQPDYVNSQWAGMCYVFFGVGHKFVLV